MFRNPYWVMPTVAALTIWWTNGFNVLLFIAGLRNIPSELYEAAALDGATPRQRFWRVTWPLLWPVTALVLTLQLILQLKIFDQIYLTEPGRPVQLVLRPAAPGLPRGLPAQPRRLRRGGRRRARACSSRSSRCCSSSSCASEAAADDRPPHREPRSLTVVTLIAAAIWFFPLYWAIVTSLRTDESVVAEPGLLPDQFQLDAFINALFNTKTR